MNDDEEDVDWPVSDPLGRKMDQLEENLHCRICNELYDNPHVLTVCGHSFCSLCIRKHFDRKINLIAYDSCPMCRAKADSNDLRKNVALSAAVECYRRVRLPLFRLYTAHSSSLTTEETVSLSTVESSYVTRAHSLDSRRNIVDGSSSKGTPITQRVAQMLTHGQKVDKIRSHLRDITKSSKIQPRFDGDKAKVEKRLRDLTHLINAQVHADHPLTLDEVIAKYNDDEKMFELEESKTAMRLRNSAPQDNFSQLIQLAQRQKRQREGTATETLAPSSSLAPCSSSSSSASVLHPAAPSKVLEEEYIFPVPEMETTNGPDESIKQTEIFSQQPNQEPQYLDSFCKDMSSVPPPIPLSIHHQNSPSLSTAVATSLFSTPSPKPYPNPSSAAPSEVRSLTEPRRARGDWSCTQCTLLNNRLNSMCEVCGAPNPNKSRSGQRSLSMRGPFASLK